MGYPNAKTRQRLWNDAKGKCCYCDELTILMDGKEGSPRRMATVEHIVARCDGGTNAYENLAIACLECNQGRHNVGRRERLSEQDQNAIREAARIRRREKGGADRRRWGKQLNLDTIRVVRLAYEAGQPPVAPRYNGTG